MKPKDSWSTEEWIRELDKVISLGRGWLGVLPSRSEGEIPSVNAAKQLAEEACEFASCISAAIHLNHKVAAYANLRPLLDRLLHAARFFEEPYDTVAWAYWSMAEINQHVNNALSQGAVNLEDRESMRGLLQDLRHWNRSEADKDQRMFRPSSYAWEMIRKAITADANARLKSAYDITSTYVHPTYRGPNAPDLGVEYVLQQAILMTSATIILCASSFTPFEDNQASYRVDPNLIELLQELTDFLGGQGRIDFAGKTTNPPEGVNSAQMLYLYGAMLVGFVFGRDVRDVIKGQPRMS